MESATNVAKKIAETLNWKLVAVQATFDVSEDKQGFFVVQLQAKKFLDPADFKAICALTRDLGGEGEYVKATRSWKVPGALAKKSPEKTPSKQGIDSQPAYKEPGNPVPTSPYTLLPVEALLTMPFMRRKDLEGSDFEDLVESVKTVGLLEPIIARPKANGLFEVVIGDRRHAAAKKAKLLEIPGIVKALTDEEAYNLRMVENVQRKNLSASEIANWLSFMIKTYGYTQEALAKKQGKTQGWVSQHLAILEMPESITRVIKSPQIGELTEGQAREILSASPEKQGEIVNEISKRGEIPSAREIREIAHPEEKPKTVPCAYCGEPVEKPVHIEGKFYHEDCAEQVQAEKDAGLVPEGHVGPFETTEQPEEEAEPAKTSQKHAEPLLTGYPWTCPDCGAKFIINHVDFRDSDRKEHRLEACGQ